VSDAGTVTLPLVDAFHEGRRFRPSIDPTFGARCGAGDVAAANLTLTYLLQTVDQPGSNLAGFVPIMAIGAAPLLVTAGLLAWVIRSRPSEPGPLPRHVVGRLPIIIGFGLPFMVMADGVTLSVASMTRPASQA
jgi:hypothetical protein